MHIQVAWHQTLTSNSCSRPHDDVDNSFEGVFVTSRGFDGAVNCCRHGVSGMAVAGRPVSLGKMVEDDFWGIGDCHCFVGGESVLGRGENLK